MRIYWLMFETIYAQVLVEKEGTVRKCQAFEVGLETFDRVEHQRQLKRAWKYIEKIAKNYARRHGSQATYTTHPSRPGAAWIVR